MTKRILLFLGLLTFAFIAAPFLVSGTLLAILYKTIQSPKASALIYKAEFLYWCGVFSSQQKNSPL
jgi:hypothetical protein